MFHKYAILLLIAVITFACGEEFLDRKPVDQIAESNFYRNESDMRSATLAIYSSLQSQGWYGEAFQIDEIPSDDSRRSAAAGIDNFAANPNDGNILLYWSGHYQAITFANTVIEKAPDADMSDEVRDVLVAEAKFLRAITYYNLVRVFGGVPIITEIPKLDRDLFPARNSVDEVYEFLIADMEEAIQVLPAEHNPGRATKGAAQAYLASVHLTLRNYAEARDLAKAVIDSDVYQLVDSISQLWVYPESENNSESIFEIQYAGCESWGTGNMRQAFFAPFNQGITGNSDGWGVMVPTTPPIDQSGTTSVDVWDDGDKRRFWTLLEPDNYYENINPEKGGYRYPVDGAGGRQANVKKYVMGGGSNVCFMSTPQNASLMRYSEVLWIYAEAVANQTSRVTVNSTVLDLINPLRTRAGLEPFEVLTVEDIELERRREFMFEGKRWFDILRKGPDEAVMLMRLAGRSLTNDKLLLPIPAIELDVNENLVQNPGY